MYVGSHERGRQQLTSFGLPYTARQETMDTAPITHGRTHSIGAADAKEPHSLSLKVLRYVDEPSNHQGGRVAEND